MADYRQFCSWCHNEVGFGSHDPDCEFMHAQRIAARDAREFEDEVREKYRNASLEDNRKEYKQLCITIRALSEACNQAERKAGLLQDYVGDRMQFHKELQQEGLTWLR